MATLQTSRQVSAYTAKTRLKQVTGREHVPAPSAVVAPSAPKPQSVQLAQAAHSTQFGNVGSTAMSSSAEDAMDFVSAAFPPLPERLRVESKPQGFTERDLQSLLLQTVTLYQDWRLVSVMHKPGNDTIVAHLLRNGDKIDPAVAMREGRTMQVIMDNAGNMKVLYARRRVNPWTSWLKRLTAAFTRRV